jgi:cytochrome P450
MAAEPRSSPRRRVLFTATFVQDPYPAYRQLLEEGPLHFVDVSGSMWGVWAVFGYAECSTVVRDPALSAKRAERMLFSIPHNRQYEFKELVRILSLWMIFIDAPEHTRMRRLMNKGFTHQGVEALRPQVEQIVDKLLEPLADRSCADLVKELAYQMPVRVISEMLGVPETMHDVFMQWSAAIAHFNGSPNRTMEHAQNAQHAVLELTEFFREAVAERRRNKGNDLISLLIDIQEEGEALTDEELYAQCVMLLFAGHETTRNLIASGVFSLLREPEKILELRDTPCLIRTAVEEFLRFETPIQYTARVTKDDYELCGVPIPKSQAILCMLGAANRDPKQFKDPQVLDLHRINNQHLAFGAGPHFCIGSQLARLEAQVAILKIIQRFPKIQLGHAAEWHPDFGFRGLKTLPVVLQP